MIIKKIITNTTIQTFDTEKNEWVNQEFEVNKIEWRCDDRVLVPYQKYIFGYVDELPKYSFLETKIDGIKAK